MQWWSLGFIEGSEFLPDRLLSFEGLLPGVLLPLALQPFMGFGFLNQHCVEFFIYLLGWLVSQSVSHSVSWVCIMSEAPSHWAVTAEVRV